MSQRRAGAIARTTTETWVELTIDLDRGPVEVCDFVDFLDRELEAFAKHGGCGLFVRACANARRKTGHAMDNHHVSIGDCLTERNTDVLDGCAAVR
jgi:imidazoleglycerol phosphate dehydratase HisB